MQPFHSQRTLGHFEPTGRALSRGRRVSVNEWEKGLLFRHGRLDSVLDPGAHRRWGSGYRLRGVDMRPWIVTIPSQEVPTADGVPVKVTVAGHAHIADPVVFVTANRDAEQGLYLAVQVALRELVATTTVDDLFTARVDTGTRLATAVSGLGELGLELDQLVIKDVIVPGELKRAQTEVLVARASGNAALERARGETAALRNLANAARMAADNPALLQLRLLQQLDGSKGHTLVIGAAALGAGVTSS
jgi:regulator of protease activity HflC (stomatin/prohibitin superfamily)